MRIRKKQEPVVSEGRYRQFLQILISPHTGEHLTERDGKLVSKQGKSYPIVAGIPVLVLKAEAMHVTPPAPEKISRNIETYEVPKAFKNAKLILHLGSGNVKCNDPRVISLDILPCENVDVVGEAEALPFADNTFDYVESGAVFEHVYDPIAAIKEVKRVLKPGGIFSIDNSFFQPYHGFPSHYFAMTTQANETYLIDDFILKESSIPESGTPLMSLSMALERFLLNLDAKQKDEVMRLPLGEFLGRMKADLTTKNPLLKNYSEYEKRSTAATHVVIAQKPADYEKKLSKISRNSETFDTWSRLKREYYTDRMEVMLRYHEIFAYKRFTLDIDPTEKFSKIKFPAPLEKILQKCLLHDPFDMHELQQKVDALKEQEEQLRETRDVLIRIYLERMDARG